MNKLLLRLVGLLAPLWRNIGADPLQLQVILEAKLKMDSRRRSSFSNMGNRNKKETKNQDVMTMVLFGFMGIAFGFIILAFDRTATGLTLYFTGWIVLVTLTLITDFTDVLIDVRDNYILFPRPINDRTITVSRLLHIGFYLSKIVLAYAITAWIILTVKFGIAAFFIFIFLMIISVIIAILIVNITYLLILRLTSPGKFKDIISYFQIGFTSLIFIGYYLLPQFIDLENFQDLDLLSTPGMWWLPSTWLGAFWDLVMNGNTETSVIVMAVLAIILPIVSIYLVANYLAKDFNQKMLSIGQGDGGQKEEGQEELQTINAKLSWRDRTAAWFTSSTAEQAGYNWTWNITQRSRTFRVKLFPMFGFIPAYFLYIFLADEGSLTEKFSSMLSSNRYIVLLYFCLFILTGAFNLTQFSERYKASWVYFATPLAKPGPVLMGSFKASAVKYFLPFYLTISIVVVGFWGLAALPDVVLCLLNVLFVGLMIAYSTQKTLPFSNAWENQSKGNNMVQGFMTLIFAGIIGAAHFFLVSTFWWVLPAFCVASAVALFLVYRAYSNLEWSQLTE
ncbi:MAG: hypothetical protein AAF705_07805 [Bacteroidota bacterium]